MNGRAFGLRSGYSIARAPGGQRQLSPEEAGRRLFGRVASVAQPSSVLLRNGGRLHLGAISRPEYATPLCGSVPDLVVHDKAGERILEGLAADSGRELRDEGIAGKVRVLKRAASPAGVASGCQEDYLVARHGDFGRLAGVLIPFLVTRQLICGEGAVVALPRGTVYCLSRWAGQVGSGGPSAARPRPLISTRDEVRAAAAGSRRLRVTVSDANMSETTTLLKAGATGLVLRMAESGAVLPDLTLASPVQALGEVSRDLTGRSRLQLASGRHLSALGIQREYLARAKDFTDRHGADAVTGRVLGMWERVLEAAGSGNPGAIARDIDWAIKYQLIEEYRARHDLPLSAPQVARADLDYHDIHRGRGGYYQLQRGGGVSRAARDIDIFEAKTVPPPAGRYRRAG